MTGRLAGVWVRAAVRRPGRGLLVVGGLLAMVLTVASAAVATDSLKQAFTADAAALWGSVDVTVTEPGGRLMDEGLARLAGSEVRARAWAGRLTLPAVAEHGGAREPHVRLLGVSEEERSFDEPLTGRGTLRTTDLGSREVIVNERLARKLAVTAGDRVELMIAVPHTGWHTSSGRLTHERKAEAVPWRVSVAGIADDTGLADLGRTPNVLARLDTVQRVLGLEGKVSGLHIAAVDDSPAATDQVVADLDALANRLGLVVTEVGREAMAIADDESGQFTAILASLALLVALGSAALTVNLLVLLGHERAAEIALLRSLGARRRTVAALLAAEGAVYTVVAAAAGTLLAVALGTLLARRIADHFAGIELGRGREFVAFTAQARPAAVAVAVGLVLLTGLVTVIIAARRVAALEIEHVLRGLPPAGAGRGPTGLRRPALTALAGALLLGMGITAAAGADFLRFAGLSLLLTAWWLHRRRDTTDRRRLDARAAAVGLLWFVAAPAALGDFGRGVESAFALLATAGAGAVVCATVLAGTRLRSAMRVVRAFLPHGRAQVVTRTAAAWAEQHRTRTGTIIGLVAVVLLMVGVMSVLGRTTAIDLDRQRGGLDAVGTSVGPVDGAALGRVPGVGNLVALAHTTIGEQAFAAENTEGTRSELRWPVRLVRADHRLADAQSFGLTDTLSPYPTAAAALHGVLADERAAVLDRYSAPQGARPGDRLVIDLGAGEEEFELIAVLDTYLLGGIVVNPARYDEMVAGGGATLVLAGGDGAMAAAALSSALNSAARPAGLSMRPAAEIAAEVTAVNARFTDLFSWVLHLGLAVALLAAGTLIHRAARERRAEVAVLRAAGFRRRDVAATVLTEPLLLGTAGLAIGAVVGLGTLVLLFAVGFADLAFVVHVGQLGTTAVITVALLVATCLPTALAAARRPPELDLRDLR